MKTKVENAMMDTAKRTIMILLAAVLMAVNLKTFVRTGGLIPGGFTGLTRLIQEISDLVWGIEPPFTLINLTLNAIPIVVSFKFIGKKFTLYSCLMIVVSGLITDIIPSYAVTTDMLLVSVFGGLFNALAMIICLMAGATAGGTDFIAIFLSEKMDIDSWNYIFAGNVVILGIAGALFGWDKALYSIIFQYASTQVLRTLFKQYRQHTLLVVTNHARRIYEVIAKDSNHGATIIEAEGSYEHQERKIVYSVVSRAECKEIIKGIKEVDPKAFVNVINTQQVSGRFYQRPYE